MTEPPDLPASAPPSLSTRAGIVTVVGTPNAGKSTLLNRVIGQKLSITSSKPQSTRDLIVGIRTVADAQMIIFDTPGLLTPRYALQESMRGAALQALENADVIVHLLDATEDDRAPLAEAAALTRPPRAHVVTVYNKIDTLSGPQIDKLRSVAPDAAFVSARTGDGVLGLLERVASSLPESPFLYPADDVSTQSMRFFVGELVRETALEQLSDEVPYSVACEVEEFREERSPVYIRAVVYVERESQKRIFIGEKGSRIREIGRVARSKIEQLVGAPVYLDLWVKVLPNWRRRPNDLRRFGYTAREETKS
jgi:GTP-binding protein Era